MPVTYVVLWLIALVILLFIGKFQFEVQRTKRAEKTEDNTMRIYLLFGNFQTETYYAKESTLWRDPGYLEFEELNKGQMYYSGNYCIEVADPMEGK